MIARLVPLMLFVACAASGADAWRSRLYPANWTPAFTDAEGRFLHDFSYAGYHHGEAPLPNLPHARVFDVVKSFHADPSGRADATPAIQAAIDAAKAAGGGVVFLPPGLYRCDGLLVVDASHIVLRGAGPKRTRLYFTRSRGMRGRAHITFRGHLRRGPDIPLARDGRNRSRVVFVTHAADLKPGDEVSVGWVITDAFVAEHGMTGVWRAFNGKWRPFFRRTVVRVDSTSRPARVELDVPLRYPCKMRDHASLRKESGYLAECGIEGLAVSNAVARKDAWAQPRVHAIRFQAVKDCWARQVVSFPSPLPEAKGYHLQNCGILVVDSKRVTIADCRMENAQNRGGGGSGYLFEVSRSNQVLTRDCVARNGRHNFVQNWDFGTAGCVWLRCTSSGGRGFVRSWDPLGYPARCEFHHSLAMACLIDSCTLDDGWLIGNRHYWSSGAGITGTQSVFWNIRGKGVVGCWQFGWGYVIGTTGVRVLTGLSGSWAQGTAPQDYTEGVGRGATLEPRSLYEDQLRRRLRARGISPAIELK